MDGLLGNPLFCCAKGDGVISGGSGGPYARFIKFRFCVDSEADIKIISCCFRHYGGQDEAFRDKCLASRCQTAIKAITLPLEWVATGDR